MVPVFNLNDPIVEAFNALGGSGSLHNNRIFKQ